MKIFICIFIVNIIICLACVTYTSHLAEKSLNNAKREALRLKILRDEVVARNPRTARDSIWIVKADKFLLENSSLLE